MLANKKISTLTLLVIILPLILLGAKVDVYSGQQSTNSLESSAADLFPNDPLLGLLGSSFAEVKQVLGEPDEQGFSSRPGPHHYMVFQHKEGVIKFYSPENTGNKTVVSIFLEQEVLGAKTGMTFSQIIDILGEPDAGPEIGIDTLYYMDYYFGDTTSEIPEVYVSFVADALNTPTHETYIKWESFLAQ